MVTPSLLLARLATPLAAAPALARPWPGFAQDLVPFARSWGGLRPAKGGLRE